MGCFDRWSFAAGRPDTPADAGSPTKKHWLRGAGRSRLRANVDRPKYLARCLTQSKRCTHEPGSRDSWIVVGFESSTHPTAAFDPGIGPHEGPMTLWASVTTSGGKFRYRSSGVAVPDSHLGSRAMNAGRSR